MKLNDLAKICIFLLDWNLDYKLGKAGICPQYTRSPDTTNAVECLWKLFGYIWKYSKTHHWL